MSNHRSRGGIVVVDPCPTVRDALSIILEMEGYEVTTFSAPEDFLAAKDIEPDCVLLDVGFAPMSGLDVLRTIGGAHYHAPVIMLSGQGDPSLAGKALADGASGFVEKPFDAEVLLAHIQGALARRGDQPPSGADDNPSRSVARPRT